MMSPGDDLRGRHVAPFAVANDRSVRRGHRSQGRDRSFGSCLLNVAQKGVEQDDRQDGNRFVRKVCITFVRPQAGGDTGGDQQQDDEDVAKLREESHPRRRRFPGSELVAPVLFKTRPEFAVGQATPAVGSECRDDGIGMPPVWLALFHDRLCGGLQVI